MEKMTENKLLTFGDPLKYNSSTNYLSKSRESLFNETKETFDDVMNRKFITAKDEDHVYKLFEALYSYPVNTETYKFAIYSLNQIYNRREIENDTQRLQKLIANVLIDAEVLNG
jgi:signal recognition particle GTPase